MSITQSHGKSAFSGHQLELPWLSVLIENVTLVTRAHAIFTAVRSEVKSAIARHEAIVLKIVPIILPVAYYSHAVYASKIELKIM